MALSIKGPCPCGREGCVIKLGDACIRCKREREQEQWLRKQLYDRRREERVRSLTGSGAPETGTHLNADYIEPGKPHTKCQQCGVVSVAAKTSCPQCGLPKTKALSKSERETQAILVEAEACVRLLQSAGASLLRPMNGHGYRGAMP
jgi:ribosomal protein L37E